MSSESHDNYESTTNRIAVIGNGLSGYLVTQQLLEQKKAQNADFSIVVVEASGFYEADQKIVYSLNHPEAYEKNVCSQELLHHPGVEYVQVTDERGAYENGKEIASN